MFLGEELTEILDSLVDGTDCPNKERSSMLLGVNLLPPFPKDTTDRNRTSPFAFTGNKFEFRMLGSSFSVSGPNFVLNTIIAEQLSRFADQLEKAADFACDLSALVKDTYSKHRRIVFNGNNYAPEWVEEANKRGLLNLVSTPEALPTFIHAKNIALFEKFGVLSSSEMHSRYEIVLDNYCKTINIEALTLIDMMRKQVLPALSAFSGTLAKSFLDKKAALPSLSLSYEAGLITELSNLADGLDKEVSLLEQQLLEARMVEDISSESHFYHDTVLSQMAQVRSLCDTAELLTDQQYWPVPTYESLLYSV
jgi:glutamine synthetase